ncbi:recombinase family protein [Vibrio splendidus]
MPTAYSYVRFSTPEQMLGDSQRRQLNLALDYCLQNGLELSDRNFKDLGISGFSGKARPSLIELLTCINEGVIREGDYILIETFDRLSREGFDATYQLIRSILLEKVIIVSLQDNLVLTESSLTNSSDIIRVAVAADLANQESQRKSVRIRAARDNARQRASEGKPSLISTNLPFWLKLEDKKIVLNEEKVSLVNRIFELSKSGHGFMSIINMLNNDKIPAPKSKIWAKSTISKLLNNRAVLGEFQPFITEGNKRVKDSKTGVIKNYYPQAVSDELFIAVQVAKRNRKTYQGGNRSKKETFSNLLQQFAKCGSCDSTMEFVDKGKPPKGGQYLTCSVAKRGGDCLKKKHYRYQTLERAFYNLAISGHINFDRSDLKQKQEMLDRVEFELIQAKSSYASLLASGFDFAMDEVKFEARKRESIIKDLEEKVRELEWDVKSSDVGDTQFIVENLLKLIDDVKENYQLRSKFNLALIKKFGTCSIQEVQGYIRVNLGTEGATFVSPDNKWLIPFYTNYMPIPMIKNGNQLTTHIDAFEIKSQIISFFDSMIISLPDMKNSFQENKRKNLGFVDDNKIVEGVLAS